MSTRKTPDNSPLSQERYMSSPEFAELRGVSGIAVDARAAVIQDPKNRELVWWLQGMSLADGGLRKVAAELLKMFPDRCADREAAEKGRCVDPDENRYIRELSLEEFLIDLCINPRSQIRDVNHPKADEDDYIEDSEMELAQARFTTLGKYDFGVARLPYFKSIIGALFEFKCRYEEAVKSGFVLTQIGEQVWETLNFSLRTGKMSAVLGLEGRGKSEAQCIMVSGSPWLSNPSCMHQS